LTPDGTLALGNLQHGINVSGTTTGLSITGNTISGNAGEGIAINSIQPGNTITGNIIGLTTDGLFALGNGDDGIYLQYSSGITIGCQTIHYKNIISGNANHGILVDHGSGNSILGNWIGISASGTTAVANVQHGVSVQNSTGNTISGNVISGNGAYG